MNSFINSQGFAKIGMMTVLIGAVLNIILDYAVNICKQSGTPSIRLDIEKNNKPMREFILKNVFKHCGTVRLKNNEEREAYERLI